MDLSLRVPVTKSARASAVQICSCLRCWYGGKRCQQASGDRHQPPGKGGPHGVTQRWIRRGLSLGRPGLHILLHSFGQYVPRILSEIATIAFNTINSTIHFLNIYLGGQPSWHTYHSTQVGVSVSAWGSWFSLSTTWASGLEPKPSGLAAIPFAGWAISPELNRNKQYKGNCNSSLSHIATHV